MRRKASRLLQPAGDRRVYFVHSFRAVPEPANADWVLATTEYGGEFVSALKRGEARPRLLQGAAMLWTLKPDALHQKSFLNGWGWGRIGGRQQPDSSV